MPLAPGSRLGTYEILAPLGVGGMGEVYRARDLTLGREVAVKILPQAFADEPGRLARFKREAQTLASLNHPHIAQIYGFAEADGTPAFMMELVEGDDLGQRLARGPLARDEAIAIALQIAGALEAAHEHGIVHRDLKPANIRVRPDGTVKVLDFGLAKARTDGPAVDRSSHSPTVTSDGTAIGTILGTAAYMSPEQARGLDVDKRTDIWAFGCVLYEMLTGRRAFSGETSSDIIAAVLGSEPDWRIVPVSPGSSTVRLLRRCLEKNGRGRLHDIADARIELEEARSEPLNKIADSSTAPRLTRHQALWSGLVLLVVGVAAWLAGAAARPSTVASPLAIHATLLLPTDASLTLNTSAAIALSPDGTRVAFAARTGSTSRLFVRDLVAGEARELAGTEGGSGPFFSPDGQWIGFYAANRIKKIPAAGGTSELLHQGDVFGGLTGAVWTAGQIYVGNGFSGGINRFPASGGESEQDVSVPDRANGEISHAFPDVLPGGKALLFTVKKYDLESFDEAAIAVKDLTTGTQKTIVRGGSHARYLPVDRDTGYVLYVSGGTLFAVPFNANRLATTGPSARVLAGVTFDSVNGVAQFSVSPAGTLVYATGPAAADSHLAWIDRTGATERLPLKDFRPGFHRLAPDGLRIATEKMAANHDIWLYDLQRATLGRLTFNGSSHYPIWAPDSRRFAFRSGQPNDLFVIAADGSSQPAVLVTNEFDKRPTSWSADGRWLAFTQDSPKTGEDLWTLSLEDKTARLYLGTPYNERGAVFSPDGQWVAYVSNATGRPEVYVQRFPVPGERWQVTGDGGTEALWGRDGREIFYRSGRRLMAVDVESRDSFRAGRPRLLFEGNFASTALHASYDATAKADRFLVIENDAAPAISNLQLVVNWLDELKRLAPRGPS